MLKQTIHLFVKACIIGILINVGLEQVPASPISPEENAFQQDQPALIERATANSD